MLKNYLSLSWKVLARRKFFTFISLFGISFTLIVLMLATAMLDHVFAPHPPETKQDRTVGIYFARFRASTCGATAARLPLLDDYMRDLPGVERMSIVSDPTARCRT